MTSVPLTLVDRVLGSAAPVRLSAPPVIVHCDGKLYARIAGDLHNALVGNPIFAGDSLADLVKRHCPEIYDECAAAGFRFVPNSDSAYLARRPPEVYFNIVRSTWRDN